MNLRIVEMMNGKFEVQRGLMGRSMSWVAVGEGYANLADAQLAVKDLKDSRTIKRVVE